MSVSVAPRRVRCRAPQGIAGATDYFASSPAAAVATIACVARVG